MLRTLVATATGLGLLGGLAVTPASADQFDRWEQYQDKYAGVVLKKTGKTYRAVGWTKKAGPGTAWCFRGKDTGTGEDLEVTVSGRMWWPDQKGRAKRILLITGTPNGRTATVQVLGRDIPGWTIGPAKLKKKKPRYTFKRTCRR